MTKAPEAGIAAPYFRLPASTRLGPVRLQVSDLDRSVRFYQEIIGLRILQESGPGTDGVTARRARLGRATDGAESHLIELVERPGAKAVGPREHLGLFHVAILLPDRRNLGRFIRHASDAGMRLGMADHLVSEAVYLNDPDGLGLEVYADRPRETWKRHGAEIRMTTDPLDVRSLMDAAGNEPWMGTPAGTTIGHVHLHVGDLDRAAEFYHEGLGFDKIVWSYPGALFLSAGGYHHHLGTNTWARGAAPAAEDDARLLEWTVLVPREDDVEDSRRGIEQRGFSTNADADGWTAADPWGTVVRVASTD